MFKAIMNCPETFTLFYYYSLLLFKKSLFYFAIYLLLYVDIVATIQAKLKLLIFQITSRILLSYIIYLLHTFLHLEVDISSGFLKSSKHSQLMGYFLMAIGGFKTGKYGSEVSVIAVRSKGITKANRYYTRLVCQFFRLNFYAGNVVTLSRLHLRFTAFYTVKTYATFTMFINHYYIYYTQICQRYNVKFYIMTYQNTA